MRLRSGLNERFLREYECAGLLFSEELCDVYRGEVVRGLWLISTE